MTRTAHTQKTLKRHWSVPSPEYEGKLALTLCLGKAHQRKKKVAVLKRDSRPDETGKKIFSKVQSTLKINKIAEKAVGLG